MPEKGDAPAGPRTLAIDCGGLGIKGSVVDADGHMVAARVRIPTPYPLPPQRFVEVLQRIAARMPQYDRVTIGMPGMIRNGVVITTPHFPTLAGPRTKKDPALVAEWSHWNAEAELRRAFGHPTRVLNDAEVQGAAVIERSGLEVMMTLGTGLGCAVYNDGRLAPHLEMSQAPVRKGTTYDLFIGIHVLRELGPERWSRRLLSVVEGLRPVFCWDRLYVGGGNARRITVSLGEDVKIVPNVAGILGGSKVWDLRLDR